MTEPRRVLVVDDSEPVRSLLAQALRSHGYAVTVADSGPAALRAAYDLLPAVAIIDQWMPGMTGAEVIRLILGSQDARVRGIRIIGLSGRPGSEKELLGAGARVFLSKPFRGADLAAALKLALDGDTPAPKAGVRREPG
jgi:CheY-like chemotaxis protein